MTTLIEAQQKVEVLQWTQKLCRALEQDNGGMKFFIEKGRKYYKVCMLWRGTQDDVSVHCFVDKKTGEVYKPAGWKKPAKHVRFDMRDEVQRARLYNICEWAGGHLYMR